MAKFETRVAGVSFYKVNFAAISSRSKVTLSPDPKNPHDVNAIKVMIDNHHVGHIPKSLNSTLIEHIKRQYNVTARVARVTGTEAHPHRGIALFIVVDAPMARRSSNVSSLGPLVVSRQEEIRVLRSPVRLPDISRQKVDWLDFLEHKKSLPPKRKVPLEPDYEALYQREVPFLQRIFKDPKPFMQEKKQEWLQACRLVEVHNEYRLEKLRSLLDQQLDNEFWQYEKEAQIARLLKALKITLRTEAEFEAKRKRGYMTVYEEFIYQSLKRHYTVFRQVIIDGRNFDFLVVLSKPYRLWVIEIDGGIHRRQAIADSDVSKENTLSRLGIHLIRVSNRCITKDHRQAVDRVLAELRQG